MNGTVLWEGDTAGATNGTITLNATYQDYKKLILFTLVDFYQDSTYTRPLIREISTEQINYIRTISSGDYTVGTCWGYNTSTYLAGDFFDIQKTSTDTQLVYAANITKLVKIIGVKHY